MNGLEFLQNSAKAGIARGAALLVKHRMAGLGELGSEFSLTETVDKQG